MSTANPILYPRDASAFWVTKPIHVPGFFISLVAAPLVVTLFTFPLFIPVFALISGGPLYLLAGTPVLLWMLGRGYTRPTQMMAAGLLTNLVLCSAAWLFGQANPQIVDPGAALTFLGFGSLFAPIWAGVFGWFYGGFSD